ncbi:hypothetical protein LR002_00065, partial [Candidatus Gracilibacteria bacterium]|nr:hypothetical protein [Candidatus Gracilibacteria bacterium]
GTGIDVLNQKIQILNDAIQNYNDSVSSGTVLISEIENLYSIFEEYAEANPLDSIEDLEFKNEMKLKANEEEEIIAENIYYSMIDDFDFSDKTNISVSNLPVIDFSIVEDFSDDLGPNYSKTLRENRIKNIITDKLNEKLSEINIQISRGGVNEATLDNFIDLGGKNINEVQISSTGTIANADDFVKSMISDTSKTLNENLKIQNKAILDSAKLVSGMTKNARIRDAEKKIKTLKKMLLVVKKQEQAYNSMEKISGCEPGDEITEKGGIKYNKDLMSCSKSDFKKDIDNQKRKIFDGLFDLSQKLNTEFIAYKDNLENSVFTDLNVVIDENGNSTCKPGTVDMGKGCVDLGKVKTQGIAYGSDAGAVVLDPFDCANATDTRACLELKNGLRLTMSGSKILIKGIVYSTEVGPIKFGGISADLDSTFETMEKLTLNDATRSDSENKKIANKVYGEIIGGFDFKYANGNFVSTGTISSNLDTIFTNNYSNFTNLDLFGDKSERILSIKNLVKEKFYSTLENLKNVENNLGIARNIVGSGEIIFDNAIQFSPFVNYLDENIFQRIKIYNLVDNLIDVNGDLTFPDLATFKDQIHIQNFEVILNAYLNNSNYSNIQNNLKENLIVLKKSQEKIGINIISGNGLYSNILNLNSQVLNFTDTGSITASSILGKIDEIKSKINVIKEQLKYLDKQNQNMINYGKIDGCSPNETQIIDGIVMNKDGKLPCSKIDFDKKIKDQKVEILNQLFTLVEEYKTEIRNYSLVVSNNLRSKNQSWIDSDGNGYCKVGTIQVGNGCIDPANIKIKGIAYGKDSGPVILDPFKCSTANASGKYGTNGAYNSVGECRIAKNALRFEIKNGKLSLVGLAYSPEVGPIKFGGIGSGMDASFGTNSNGTDIKKSCLEIKNQGLSNGDGVYLIDPDGVGIGEDAFEVYCNMNNY